MRQVISKADESHAQAVHDMMSAIPWISEATKSTDGFTKTKESCARGEVFIVTVGSTVASMMILRKDNLAASSGYNVWRIPLITTIELSGVRVMPAGSSEKQRKSSAKALFRRTSRTTNLWVCWFRRGSFR
jgi:hypothetical protein